MIPRPETHLNADALVSAVDKVGDDLPCVGTALLQWVSQ